MRNVQYIIEDIREASENQDVSEFSGIQDREILRYINNAQERIQAEIVKKSPKVFTKETIIPVDGSPSYNLPYDIMLGNKVTNVEYRYAETGCWERLEPDYVANLDSMSSVLEESPSTYIRLNGKIVLRPRVRRGWLRVTYVAALPRIDLRRGAISSATISGGLLSALTLDTTGLDMELSRGNGLSIVNGRGSILIDNIPYEEVSSSTGVVTLESSVSTTLAAGDILGKFVVMGIKASTHHSLDASVERYLIEYTVAKLLQRDGSGELANQMVIVQGLESEIIDSYAEVSDDILKIPDIDRTFDEF